MPTFQLQQLQRCNTNTVYTVLKLESRELDREWAGTQDGGLSASQATRSQVVKPFP